MTKAMPASCNVTGSFVRNQLVTGSRMRQEIAEVALHHAAHPVAVLHHQRLVQPQLGADLRQHRRVALLPGETRAGSPGMSCCRPNTSMLTSSRVGMTCAMRSRDGPSSRRRQARAALPGDCGKAMRHCAILIPCGRMMLSGTGTKPDTLADRPKTARGA